MFGQQPLRQVGDGFPNETRYWEYGDEPLVFRLTAEDAPARLAADCPPLAVAA
jgi:hypothetical protein